jgi:hypothetical protein
MLCQKKLWIDGRRHIHPKARKKIRGLIMQSMEFRSNMLAFLNQFQDTRALGAAKETIRNISEAKTAAQQFRILRNFGETLKSLGMDYHTFSTHLNSMLDAEEKRIEAASSKPLKRQRTKRLETSRKRPLTSKRPSRTKTEEKTEPENEADAPPRKKRKREDESAAATVSIPQPGNVAKESAAPVVGSLEVMMENLCCMDVDLRAKNPFPEEFLIPNEPPGTGLQPHIDAICPGIMVSVGTERSFFDLALSDPTKCDGLVVRDVNPRVKAYVDFNVLLLRICNSREEFRELAQQRLNEYTLEPFIDSLQKKLAAAQDIPPSIKEYYQRNLRTYLGVYYSNSARKNWARLQPGEYDEIDRLFSTVNYYENDALFTKLQQYAKQGKIIATVGSIEDLEFLHGQKVSLIDSSNIFQYVNLDIPVHRFSGPTRLIHTEIGDNILAIPATYLSFQYTPLSVEQKEEMRQLLTGLSKETLRTAHVALQKFAHDRLNTPPLNMYCRESFEILKKGIVKTPSRKLS